MKSRITVGMLILLATFISIQISFANYFNVSTIEELKNALIESASNGEDDTIHLAPGTYELNSTLKYFPIESENFSLTIEGEDPEATILNGGNNYQILYLNLRNLDAYDNVTIDIKNLSFVNGNSRTMGGAIGLFGDVSTISINKCQFNENESGISGGSIFLDTNANIQIKNNSFKNNVAIYNGGSLSLLQIRVSDEKEINIENNIFDGNISNFGGAIYIISSINKNKFIFKNNIISNNIANIHGGGIYSSIFYGDIYLLNNLIIKNKADGKSISTGGALFLKTKTSKIYVVNNTISGNKAIDKSGGVYTYISDINTEINLYNNILRDNILDNDEIQGKDLLIAVYDEKNPTIKIFNNNLGEKADLTTFNSEDLTISPSATIQEGENIKIDPNFINPKKGNFHLKSFSPCRNKGSNSILEKLADVGIKIDRDIDNNDRIIENTVDIGADEIVTPNIEISTDMLDFGEFLLGDESKTKEVTFHDNFIKNLKIEKVLIFGFGDIPNSYQIVENTCKEGLSLNSDCKIGVKLIPNFIGQKRAVLIVKFVDDENNEYKFVIKLFGVVRGEKEPNIETDKTFINFGNVVVNQSSDIQTVEVLNSGDEYLLIHKIKIYGINADEFYIDSETCTQAPIAPNESCEIQIHMLPTEEGIKRGVINIRSNDPDRFYTIIKLKGYGISSDLEDLEKPEIN